MSGSCNIYRFGALTVRFSHNILLFCNYFCLPMRKRPTPVQEKGLKRQSLGSLSLHRVNVGDLAFPAEVSGANYDAQWKSDMTASDLYAILLTDESSILFCAREGWIDSDAPNCLRKCCNQKANKSSYLYKRKKEVWS